MPGPLSSWIGRGLAALMLAALPLVAQLAPAEAELAARAAAAVSLVDSGQLNAGLELAEELLHEEPDQPALRELVARPQLRLGVPAWETLRAEHEDPWEPLIAVGSRGVALQRERAFVELARSEGRARRGVLEAARLGLDEADDARRHFCALLLRRLEPGSESEWMQRHAVLDRDPAVRAEASRALRDARDEALVEPLLELLEHELPALRKRAAQGLALAGYARAVEPLFGALVAPPAASAGSGASRPPSGSIFVGRQVGFVQDFDTDVATSAAVGDPKIGVIQTGMALDGRATLAGGGRGRAQAQAAARAALVRLTGTELRSTSAWKRWWEREGRALYARPSAPNSTDDAPVSRRAPARGR